MENKNKETIVSKTLVSKGADQLLLLVEGVLDYAIFMLAPEGRIVTWNAGAERINGYKAADIIGKHFSIFYPEEDVRAGKPKRELEIAKQEGRFEDEGWRVRKDGSKFWANVIITAIRDESGELIGYGKVTRDFTERMQHDRELAESEERFRLLVEGVPDYAIFMMDPEGKVATWNVGAERIKGYTASEIIGRSYSTFFPEQDVQAGKPQQILAAAVREGKVHQEGWRLRKDGSQFWANAVLTALRDESGKLVGFSKITRDATERMRHDEALQREVTERQKAQEELLRSEKSLRQLSLNLLRTQDEERRRIGRDLHDSIGQYLSALKMNLGMLKVSQLGISQETSQELDKCTELLEECVKEVRTISYLLYPPMLEEMGLKPAIAWYLDGFTKRSGVEMELDVPPYFDRLSRDAELALFRVLQESLTNVLKHSNASKVHIHLARYDGTVTLEIRDNGKGLPPAVLLESGNNALGVGLRGMNERMRQLGGSLKLSAASPGALVRAILPLQEPPET